VYNGDLRSAIADSRKMPKPIVAVGTVPQRLTSPMSLIHTQGTNGNGSILVGKDNTPDVRMSICLWLWDRLHQGGVGQETGQSLAVVTTQNM
jgi:hypothetical protein